ncbi:unnamed protein product [Lepeophtheirus salmonis]|uniref:(salmon louse) hypothetical protein n=1 Tax=Lepeophtheirus salmonis TaxID=72036 RepID=A0A7R8H3R8_LEPSM|nr:unnamed protein product [Lepeophtheirus salmonis]CAF2838151.1 unnamed protein product [Lepeophtheirus salmonis]
MTIHSGSTFRIPGSTCADIPANLKNLTSWLNPEYVKYKCPNGFEFKISGYPFFFSNCTVRNIWEPSEVEECIPRKCLKDPVEPFENMTVRWPNQSRSGGIEIKYHCPFRYTTDHYGTRVQSNTCIWNNETDLMEWTPDVIYPCSRKYELYLIIIEYASRETQVFHLCEKVMISINMVQELGR